MVTGTENEIDFKLGGGMAKYAGRKLVDKRIERAAARAEKRAAKPKKKTAAQLLREARALKLYNGSTPLVRKRRKQAARARMHGEIPARLLYQSGRLTLVAVDIDELGDDEVDIESLSSEAEPEIITCGAVYVGSTTGRVSGRKVNNSNVPKRAKR